MFRFFKRKKSSDDTVKDSSSSSGVVTTDPEVAAQDEHVRPIDGVVEPESSPTSPGLSDEAPKELPEGAADVQVADERPVEAPNEQPVGTPSETPVGTANESPVETPEESPAELAPEPSVEPSPAVTDNAPTPALGAAKADEKGGSWFARLRKGLSRTGQSIGGLFVDVQLDEDLYEELETALIMADAGMDATTQLLEALRAKVRKERLTEAMQARAALRDLLTEHLQPLEKTFPLGSVKPLIVMIAGVNGAGKTTSIGKLANTFQANGAHVLLAAGDTFRAAAREQLMEWGSRNNVSVIAQEGGDPAAVAFDAVNAGRARKADVVMIDTAGRLPTQLHLMEELKKIKRVVNKAEGSAPHEVLLVVDGNSGQNVLAQIRSFDAAIGLTGLVVTKLDGTAKGGILAAVAAGSQGVRPVPVYWIGVGEGIHDLQPFKAHEFAAALIGDPVQGQ